MTEQEKQEEERREEERRKRQQEDDDRIMGIVMGDMLNTGIPGGIDGDFGTPF